jgi:hypothetical protein
LDNISPKLASYRPGVQALPSAVLLVEQPASLIFRFAYSWLFWLRLHNNTEYSPTMAMPQQSIFDIANRREVEGDYPGTKPRSPPG